MVPDAFFHATPSYFDHYGIIRDIMQNHLLQILALFAMETPVSLDAEDIRNEKVIPFITRLVVIIIVLIFSSISDHCLIGVFQVKVLRSMRPLQLDNVVIGQYKGHTKGGVTYPGYTDDKTVPKDSLTPTFAAAALFIDNARWDGVPFLMKAGKALHTKRYVKSHEDLYFLPIPIIVIYVFYFLLSAEIRVQFRHVPGNLYNKNFGCDLDRATNELVIRVQPDEAIYLKINNKVPGLGMRLDRSNLNLLYSTRYLFQMLFAVHLNCCNCCINLMFTMILQVYVVNVRLENLSLHIYLFYELPLIAQGSGHWNFFLYI